MELKQELGVCPMQTYIYFAWLSIYSVRHISGNICTQKHDHVFRTTPNICQVLNKQCVGRPINCNILSTSDLSFRLFLPCSFFGWIFQYFLFARIDSVGIDWIALRSQQKIAHTKSCMIYLKLWRWLTLPKEPNLLVHLCRFLYLVSCLFLRLQLHFHECLPR